MRLDPISFAQRCARLPSLPAICNELTQAIQDPESSVHEISMIIGRDQSLAARVLKLANSVVYGFPAQVATLDHAVQLVGLHEIRDLVLATCTIAAFDQIPEGLVDGPSFWKHSIACGLACVLLAEERNHPEPERLFVGGLLHDIGRLVMLLVAPEESRRVLERCETEGQLCSRIESETFGFDHATLGAELVCSWNLPRPLVQMVRSHHQLPKTSMMMPDIFIVHYADFITSALEFGNSGEQFIAPLTVPPNVQRYLLPDDRLQAVTQELTSRCNEIFPILTKAQPVEAVAEEPVESVAP